MLRYNSVFSTLISNKITKYKISIYLIAIPKTFGLSEMWFLFFIEQKQRKKKRSLSAAYCDFLFNLLLQQRIIKFHVSTKVSFWLLKFQAWIFEFF